MIRENLETGDTSLAIQNLIEFIDNLWSYKDKLISQHAQVRGIEEGTEMGTLPNTEAIIQENRLRWATLQSCSDIEAQLVRYFPEIKQKVKVTAEPFENQAILELLKKYDDVRKLFTGNSAVFFKGTERNSSREVIMRVFKTQDFSVTSDQDIQKNLNILLGLKHRNIIKVLSTNLSKFPQYLVLEYINGSSLDHMIGNIPFTLYDSIELLEQLADALYYLHINGVAHKTIKPDKILIDDELKPMISPFEIFSSDMLSYSNVDLIENLLYSAPEVLKGQLTEPDDKSDQFSLGALAYELLSGRPLFAQKKTEKAALNVDGIFAERLRFFKVKKDRKEILDRLDIPKPYEMVLDRMLAEDPDERFPCMQDVIEVLQSIKLTLDRDIEVALSSYKRCVVRNPDFTADFYRVLLAEPSADDPQQELKREIIRFFEASREDEERGRKRQRILRVAINLLLLSSQEPQKLSAVAAMQVHAGIRPALYHHFIDVLIQTIKENDYLWQRYNDLCDSTAEINVNPIDEAWDRIRLHSHQAFIPKDQSPAAPEK